MIKVNLGCGSNRLQGWMNHDSDVDITRALPWKDDSVDCVFAEHVVEHVTYDEALEFFVECHRMLRTGGVLRIAVPSVERIWREATPKYCEFTRRWAQPASNTPSDELRGAMTNILYRHGHRAPWTQGLLLASLFYAGFDEVRPSTPGHSDHPELVGVEGHGHIIGETFNLIETVVVEATK